VKKIILFAVLLTPLALCAQRPVVPSSPTVADLPPAPPPSDQISGAALDGQNLYITTDDGWSINMTVKDPSDGQSKYVILLPDLGDNKSSYAKLANALSDRGFGYAALDLRGHGKSARIHYSKFSKTGIDNQFNKMYKDVNAAVNYLKTVKNVAPKNIFILGSGLGANVAANSIVFNNDIGGAALISPSSNIRDVLAIPGVKVSKIPLLIAAAPDNKKLFLEASLIRNIAFLAQGPGRITFVTAFDKDGTDMINAYITPNILAWVRIPAFPGVKEDSSATAETAADAPPPAEDINSIPL